MRWRLLLVAALAGMVVLAAELVGARLLAPHVGSDIVVWSALLGVVMGALALGYLLGGMLADRWPRPASGVSALLGAAGGIVLMLLVGDALAAALGAQVAHPGVAAAAICALLLAPPALLLASVSPLLLRLAAPDVAHTGRIAGQLFAAGTLGSIAGSILTGFWLIPTLGTSTSLLLLATACLLAASILAGAQLRGQAFIWGIALIVLLPAIGFAYRGGTSEDLMRTDSAYAQVRVTEHRGVRALWLNNQLQSAMRPAAPDEELLPYVRALWLGPAAVVRTRPLRVLVVGLGGGTFPRALARQGMRVQVYEIDPVVVDAARRWFALPAAVRVHIGDGRRLLARTQERFDVVVMDAYRPSGVPFHLVTTEAVALMRARLAPDGVLVANVWGTPQGESSRLWRAVAATLSEHFGQVQVHPVPGRGMRNIMVIAGDRLPTPAQLRARATALRPTTARPLALAAPLALGSGVVLRDDRADTEQSVAPDGSRRG